jgi:hypothetical protein
MIELQPGFILLAIVLFTVLYLQT